MTPGRCSALETSIFRIRACATWLRRNAACSMAGSSRSSMNKAWPVRSLRSSLRLIGSPKVRVDMLSAPHPCRGRQHGIDDVLVAGAAAQIARKCLAHLFFTGRRRFVEKARHVHEDAGRAVAALQAVMVVHRLLQRMVFAVLGRKAFN